MADKPHESVPAWLADARSHWSNTGVERPPFAIDPGPEQESVWDYPRPPALVADGREVVVGSADRPVARTTGAIRVCETASPPTFYLPPDGVDFEQLVQGPGTSFCEWKGPARYWCLAEGAAKANHGGSDVVVGWDYPTPFDEFSALAGFVSFYPGRIRCTVDGEVVQPQAGGFYGGWITNEIVGPYKGDAGTEGW